MRRGLFVMVAAAVAAALVGWFLATRLPNWLEDTASVVAGPPPTPVAETERKIRARLYYVSEDGAHLVGVEREVPYAEGTAHQARFILEEQLKPAPAPLAMPLPPGTSIRDVFLTDQQEAFVDLSREATSAHTGGSMDELFSVYAIVNALTVNLPAILRVQILVDGKEVDSLAGHVDLRRPLPRNLTWVAAPEVPVREEESAPAELPGVPNAAIHHPTPPPS